MIDKVYNNLLIIGSTGQNSGKTTFAKKIIHIFKNTYPIVSLKITTIDHDKGGCPRGGKGCGVCASLKGKYELIEECSCDGKKDTEILLASGSRKVFWLRVQKEFIKEAFTDFLSNITSDDLIICESNSLRKVVKPALFIVMKNNNSYNIKESASEVIDLADLLITFDGKSIDFNIDRIVYQNKWLLQ